MENLTLSDRDKRQRIVIDWGTRCFGADHMADKIVRAARFLEEAVEFAQAAGLPKDHAQRALDYVYSRPAGDPAQECGGVSNTQYALAGALGLSVAECEAKEIDRCLAKRPEHFAQRNRNKVEKIDAAPPDPFGNAEVLRKLEPGEPFFVLRGQDKLAAGAVRFWANEAEKYGVADPKVANARMCAHAMVEWRPKKMPD